VIAATLQPAALLETRGDFDADAGIRGGATLAAERHWERVYATRNVAEASWYQPCARQSLAMIAAVAGAPARILDVGGGASTLAGDLLARGWRDLTVLDISATALDLARAGLGAEARQVKWIQADITRVGLPSQKFDVWHDRGVFHYLTDRARRAAYVAQVRRTVRPGGHVIVGVFGLDGPRHCCGLPVLRFTAETLQAEFGEAFELVDQAEERHCTPGGASQAFVYARFVVGEAARPQPGPLGALGNWIAASNAGNPSAMPA
jgi:SAM-dependent methyltransferase